MIQVERVSIAGQVFEVEVSAFNAIRRYLREQSYQDSRTDYDIEKELADALQAECGGRATVTMDILKSAVTRLGKTVPAFEETQYGPADDSRRYDNDHYEYERPRRPVRKLYRIRSTGKVAGVCSGIGEYLNADPKIFRILFIVFTLMGSLVLWRFNHLFNHMLNVGGHMLKISSPILYPKIVINMAAPIFYIILWIVIPEVRKSGK